MSETDFTSESRASQLFHQGHYQEALRLYTAIYDRLPRDGDTRIAVGVLLSRSACHLKLVSISDSSVLNNIMSVFDNPT